MKATVIIPTFNRKNQLINTLKSLTEISFNKADFEIIVIDNGSNDGTKELIEKFHIQYSDLNLYYYYDDTPGLLTGRHLGARKSNSDLLVFIDDDVKVSTNWLSSIVDSFENNNDLQLLGGKCLPDFQSQPPFWVEYFWQEIPGLGKMLPNLSLCDFGEEFKIINPSYIWGLNFSIRKSTLWKLGGFNPDNMPAFFQEFQGDGETGLALKFSKLGLLSMYNPNVLLFHCIPDSRLTIEYFERRAFYQGICNSFTRIQQNKLEFLISSLRRLVDSSKYLFTARNSKKVPSKIKIIKIRLDLLEQAGFDFHQKVYHEFPEVKNWVDRLNYLEL